MVSSEFVVKVSRHSHGSGNPGSGGAPATGFRLAVRLAGMTSLEWDAGETDCSKHSHEVDGLSLVPVSSLVRNHSNDFIREGGIDNG
jgi:hypothetical protein